MLKMEVTINLGAETVAIVSELFERLDKVNAAETKTTKPSKGKKNVKEDQNEIEDEEENEDDETPVEEDDDEDSDAENSDSDDDEENEDDESEGTSQARLSESDLGKLKDALRKYSTKRGKDNAVKILRKFGKTSQDVKKTDLPKILKLLKV